MPKLNLAEGTIPPEILDTLSVTREDFFAAIAAGEKLSPTDKNYKAYIEVVSFDRLLNGARERNRAFFDKLGLPTN